MKPVFDRYGNSIRGTLQGQRQVITSGRVNLYGNGYNNNRRSYGDERVVTTGTFVGGDSRNRPVYRAEHFNGIGKIRTLQFQRFEYFISARRGRRPHQYIMDDNSSVYTRGDQSTRHITSQQEAANRFQSFSRSRSPRI